MTNISERLLFSRLTLEHYVQEHTPAITMTNWMKEINIFNFTHKCGFAQVIREVISVAHRHLWSFDVLEFDSLSFVAICVLSSHQTFASILCVQKQLPSQVCYHPNQLRNHFQHHIIIIIIQPITFQSTIT